MANTTEFTSFILGAYFDCGQIKYLYLVITIFLYILIVVANTLLIAVISFKRCLHQPMYIFLASLFVNELYGSTGLFPFLMVQLVSEAHTISAVLCFLQIFVLYSYGAVELSILAVMAYDRYLAICFPLRYKILMTTNKACLFVVLTWSFCYLKSIINILLSIRVQLCGNIINKVYCDNYLIVKLACSSSDTKINNLYGIINTTFSVGAPIIPITFSYVQILVICSNGSKETRQKAIATCTPHLVSLLHFSFGCFFEIVQSRFNMTYVPNIGRIILSLYFLVCQPLFSPIVYGLRMTKIKEACKDLLLSKL
ncbi:olfactory receptor 4B13-like [Aplochiton taeniatus]